MIEKRRYPRYAVPCKVTYASMGLAAIEASTIAVNISLCGIRMLISRLIKQDDRVKLRIDLRDNNQPVRAFGKVVWTREIGKFEMDAGIEFTKIEPADSNRLKDAFLTLKSS